MMPELLLYDHINVKKQHQDDHSKNCPQDYEDLVYFVILLRESLARGVKASSRTLFKLIETHTPLHRHCLFKPLCRRRRRIGLEPHLDLAKAQYLPDLEHGLGYFLPIDKRAISRIQIPNNDVRPP